MTSLKKPFRILLFTGDGKGKTTAALGMALRAAGHGMRSLIIQFVKNNGFTGELESAKALPGLEVIQTGLSFIPSADKPEYVEHKREAEKGLEYAAKAMESGRYDLIVLDEICTAVSKSLLEEGRVVEAVNRGRSGLTVVMTGRGAGRRLIDLADTVSEIRCIKHGYRKGWKAQRGVEY